MSTSTELKYTVWADHATGLLENQVAPGTSYEVPAEFIAWAANQGESYGAARVVAELALADDSGIARFVDGGTGVRKHLAAERAAKVSIPARKLVASETERKALAEVRAGTARDRVPLLIAKEDDAKNRAACAEDDLDKAVAERDELSLAERGLIKSKWVLGFIEGGAVAFDCALLHGSLEYSGAGSASVWMTSVLAPAAIAGVHVTFGTMAGWVASQMPDRRRLKAAAGALVVGFGVLLAAFVCLAVFREAGNDALNSGLAEIASGDESASPELFISSLWMAPLQVAASIGAVLAIALWVIGQPGRDADLKVAETKQAKSTADTELEQSSGQVEAAREEIRVAELSVPQMSVDALEAEAENEALANALSLRLGAEDALGESAKARFKAAYVLSDRVYDNGRVRRAAMGDEERRGSKIRRRPSRDVSEQALAGDLDTTNNTERAGGRGARRWFS